MVDSLKLAFANSLPCPCFAPWDSAAMELRSCTSIAATNTDSALRSTYLPSLGLVVAEPYQRPVATEYVLSLRSSMDCKKLEPKPQTGPYLEQLLAA